MKIITGVINFDSVLLAKASSNDESNSAQGPKVNTQPSSTSSGGMPDNDENEDNKHKGSGTGDVTAESKTGNCSGIQSSMRARSDRSSSNPAAKGRSKKLSAQRKEIQTSLKVLAKQLDNHIDTSGKYNGIIRLISVDLLKYSYSLIKSNPGNLTKGSSPETLDRISNAWFEKTAKDILQGRFKFDPVRLVEKNKSNKSGAVRKLHVLNPRHKVVQKALQLILGAIWEPTFSTSSFGFRPGKSVKHALDLLHMRGGPYAWAINGDITKCFDSIPHDIVMNIIKERIKCVRTLTLIERSLKAGYISPKGIKVPTNVGTPQGSILSPLLCNIVLDKLDKFMEGLVSDFSSVGRRRRNPEYTRLENQRKYWKLRDPQKATKALHDMRLTPKLDMHDPNYRRVMYVRYADDFVVLVAGTLAQANEIKAKIGEFLKGSCGLELNLEKTTVTNTRKGFSFLGAELKRRDNASIFNSFKGKEGNKVTRRSTLRLAVDAPIENLINKLIENGYARRNHKGTVLAKGVTSMVHLSHFDIVKFFNSKVLGLLNAYSFAGNFSNMSSVIWFLRQSCALTLARKFKLRTLRKTFNAFGFDLKDPATDIKFAAPTSYKATMDYGLGFTYKDPLKANSVLKPKDTEAKGNEFYISIELEEDLSKKADKILNKSWAKKLTYSLPSACAVCGSTTDVEMHHLRKVADVRAKIRTGDAT